MKVSYKGIPAALSPKLQQKLDAKFGKLSKLLEKRGEKEAHVVITGERHLHHAEVTVQFYDHQLVGLASDADLFTALSTALDKLEKQGLKQATRWREKTRRSEVPKGTQAEAPETPAAANATDGHTAKRVFRVNHHRQRKPMTLDEAVLEMEKDRDYLVYRDAERECVSVLVRRRDGHFDLIES